eukprot:357283-Chlamydomonas_euryale.AAC.4
MHQATCAVRSHQLCGREVRAAPHSRLNRKRQAVRDDVLPRRRHPRCGVQLHAARDSWRVAHGAWLVSCEGLRAAHGAWLVSCEGLRVAHGAWLVSCEGLRAAHGAWLVSCEGLRVAGEGEDEREDESENEGGVSVKVNYTAATAHLVYIAASPPTTCPFHTPMPPHRVARPVAHTRVRRQHGAPQQFENSSGGAQTKARMVAGDRQLGPKRRSRMARRDG